MLRSHLVFGEGSLAAYATKKAKILDRKAREFVRVHIGVPSTSGIASEVAQGLIPCTAQQMAAIVSSPQLL